MMPVEASLIQDNISRHMPARLRRELRNPSIVTVIVMIVAVLAVPLAILTPSWVSTTQGSLELRQAAGAQRDAAIVSASSLVSSQIVPWMLNQVTQLETADDPESWHNTSFSEGPCNSTNLSNLPAGKYADAISTSCSELGDIQISFSADCASANACVVSDAALSRLSSTRQALLATFSEAGFVSDYKAYDERWMR